jgi:hypothetical protein
VRRKKLLLPGDVARSGGGLTIHVPSGYETEDDRMAAGGYLVCKVIVDADKRVMCGQIFELDREAEFQRHTGECAHRHLDEIRKASPTHRIPIFNEEEWDPELAEHLQKVGRTMLEEGRLTMNRNERAGG